MSTPNPTPQPGRQTYMAPVADVYAAMVQMLGFNASFDLVHQDEQSHAVTFSAPNLNGLFTAKVVSGENAASSAVEMTAPIDAGETAQQLVMKFYKDLGDQLMAQTAVQATSAQTTVMSAPTQQTEVVPPVPAANTAHDASHDGQNTPAGPGNHRASKNTFMAMLTDNNPGKTSTMAVAALVVAVLFLIFGFVALGTRPPISLCIIFAVIAAVLCVVAYLKTQPGKKHGRMLTVIAVVSTVVGLVLSLVGGLTGGSVSSSTVLNEKCEDIAFPRDGISAKLPEMKKITGRISYEYADHMSMKVCGASEDTFDGYLADIKKAGFTVDYEKNSHSYQALNDEGDKVRLYFDDDDSELSIEIESASYIDEREKENAEYEKKRAEEEAQKKAKEEAEKQAEEQKKAEEAQKQAEEERKRQEEEQKRIQEEEAKKQQEAQSQAQSGGVTPAVKEAMDSYESFMNKYCDFMEKYTADGAPTSMLADYLKMMNEYSETTKKLDDMDQSTWTDADMQYYLEVMNRVNQRLASVS
ncbi:actin [Bifidobacterium pseudolongum subsp. globosum]|uniref:Actin n=2 Tax=Bifidobacterium pseudolongum TaxID=1694 RepID=A0A4Q5A330_9BIFI|nr:actin [Bifidobacterium pseudolongum subsp. globosum]